MINTLQRIVNVLMSESLGAELEKSIDVEITLEGKEDLEAKTQSMTKMWNVQPQGSVEWRILIGGHIKDAGKWGRFRKLDVFEAGDSSLFVSCQFVYGFLNCRVLSIQQINTHDSAPNAIGIETLKERIRPIQTSGWLDTACLQRIYVSDSGTFIRFELLINTKASGQYAIHLICSPPQSNPPRNDEEGEK